MASIIKAINELGAKDVLVGVPEGNTDRKSGDPATNALIGYVQEFGSPANNIPARPFLIPGVQDIQKPASDRLKVAAQRALSGDLSQAEKQLNAAGMMGQNSARAKINSNIQPKLSERTLAARRARGVTRENTLIDTGQLRNSITYVIRKK
ncbi:hypothetical protein [Caballeronia sp. INDeC2]|uniref:hypothetical protein n=1 Tax=Caballeronia sp. INDeC2 TaxID=2921747 RepID=UPI0020285599|nr:hypothetical protein [Caballeronia sp. INDeC2]